MIFNLDFIIFYECKLNANVANFVGNSIIEQIDNHEQTDYFLTIIAISFRANIFEFIYNTILFS